MARALAAVVFLVLHLIPLPLLRGQSSRATQGEWSPVVSWPVVAVHLHVLPDGRLLTWGGAEDAYEAGGSEAYLWDPDTDVWEEVANPTTNVFCGGHAFAPDGRLLVTGGHITPQEGVRDTNFFDFRTDSWSAAEPMNLGRWYPTTTPLPNGEMLVISGFITPGVKNNLPQVYRTSGGWRDLSAAVRAVPIYPWMFTTPDGRAYIAGPVPGTRFLNTAGSGSWTTGPSHVWKGTRWDGAAVMYEEGKILVAGGGRPTAVRTAEIVDLHASKPLWRTVGSMAFARRHPNSTILADGTVLVTGGTTTKNDTTKTVLASEIWDPATQLWRTVAPLSELRQYHSTAVLLEDARVLAAGGGAAPGKGDRNHPTAQIYSPGYLFASDGSPAVRPTIDATPEAVVYGETFLVETSEPAEIARVNLIRLSSVTHSFNHNQRLNRLAFSITDNGLNITAPGNQNQAPPGHYMLFILNGAGVPSTAAIVRLGTSSP